MGEGGLEMTSGRPKKSKKSKFSKHHQMCQNDMKRRGRHQNVVFEPHFGSRASLGHLLRVLDGRRDGMGIKLLSPQVGLSVLFMKPMVDDDVYSLLCASFLLAWVIVYSITGFRGVCGE